MAEWTEDDVAKLREVLKARDLDAFAALAEAHDGHLDDPLPGTKEDRVLHLAASAGFGEAMTWLLEHGASHIPNKHGNSPFYIVCEKGSLELAELLLNGVKDLDVNQADADGWTALAVAARASATALVARLLQGGAALPSLTIQSKSGLLPIHFAAEGTGEIVQALVGAGADINAGDVVGRTPLYLAAGFGNVELVAAILAAGADPNKAPSNGITPLLAAVNADHESVIPALINGGADLNLPDKAGNTPLTVSIKRNKKSTIALLEAFGASAHVSTTATRWRLLLLAALSWFQLIFTSLQVGTLGFQTTIPYPSSYSFAASVSAIVLFDFPEFLPDLTFYASLWLGVGVILFAVLLWLGLAASEGLSLENSYKVKPLLSAGLFLGSTVGFISLSRALISPLDCTYDPETDTAYLDGSLEEDQQLECWTGFHPLLAALSTLILIPFLYISVRLSRVDGQPSRLPPFALTKDWLLNWADDHTSIQAKDRHFLEKSLVARTTDPILLLGRGILAATSILFSTYPILLASTMLAVSAGVVLILLQSPPFKRPIVNAASTGLFSGATYSNFAGLWFALASTGSDSDSSFLTVSGFGLGYFAIVAVVGLMVFAFQITNPPKGVVVGPVSPPSSPALQRATAAASPPSSPALPPATASNA